MSDKGLIQTSKRIFLYVGAAIVILLAVGTTLARLALQVLPSYQQDIEQQFAHITGYPVEIGNVEVGWHGFNPVVDLADVRIYEPEMAGKLVTHFRKLRLKIGVVSSLQSLSPQVDMVYLNGLTIGVERSQAGKVNILGIRSQGGRQFGIGEMIAFSDFLPSQIIFSDVVVNYEDKRLNRRTRLHDLRLQWQKDRKGIEVMIKAQSESDAVRSAKAVVRWQGTAAQWQQAKFEVYGEMQGVHLGSVAQSVEWHPLPEVEAQTVNLAFWGYGVGSQLHWAQAQMEQDQTVYETLLAEFKDISTGKISANVSFKREPDGWLVSGDQITLEQGSLVLPTVAFQYRTDAKRSQLSFSDIDIEGVSEFARQVRAMPEQALAWLNRLQPRGHINALDVSWNNTTPFDIEQQIFPSVILSLSGFAMNAWEQIPGVKGVSADVVFQQGEGELTLYSQNLGFEYPPLFDSPVTVDQAKGKAYFQIQSASEWSFAAENVYVKEQAFEGLANFSMQNDALGPFMNLRAQVLNAPAEKVMSSFPYNFMPEKAQDFLKRSIRAGNAELGRFLLYGRAKNFPFRQGEGIFHIEADVKNGQFDPAPGWPSITQADAKLRFHGLSFEATTNNAKIYDAQVKKAAVSIDNLAHTVVNATGELQGNASSVSQFFSQVPLFKRFPVFRAMKSAGEFAGELSLSIPVRDVNDTKVKGSLRLRNAAVAWPEWKVALQDANADIQFTQASIRADSISARFKQQPVNGSVLTREIKGVPVMLLEAKSWLSVHDVFEDFFPNHKNHAQGRSEWMGEITVPLVNTNKITPMISVTSNMVGTELKLPEPLGKTANDIKPVTASWRFEPKRHRVELGVEGLGNARLILVDGKKALTPKDLLVHFGSPLPKKVVLSDGITVSGRVASLNVETWMSWLRDTIGVKEKPHDSGLVLKALDVNFGELLGYNQHYKNLGVSWKQRDDYGKVVFSGEQIDGYLTHSNHLWYGRFKRLSAAIGHGKEGESTQVKVPSPFELPAVDLKVDKLTLGDLNLGALNLLAEATDEGYELKQLSLQGAKSKSTMTGKWELKENAHRTSLRVNVSSDNVGRMLGTFGFKDQIKKGKGKLKAALAWRAAPMAFDVNSLSGSMEMEVDKGQVLAVDPGAGGRLFGLMSISALPRRLTLDFNDVTGEGLAFDKIYAKYRIRNGVATSIEAFLNGPAVFVRSEGDVDLANRTYNQKVIVVPKLLSGMPVLGGLAGGPALGVLLLFAQQLMESNVEDMDGIRYEITGPWDNPDVKDVTPKQDIDTSKDDVWAQ